MASPNSKFKLDRAGVRALLNSPAAQAMSLAAAKQVAAAVQVKDGVEVVVRTVKTDRACAAVSLAHPGGLGIQAKYGTLTRAAAAVGLIVKPR
ncbi:hypothetical protein [Rhodococcus sp. AQ5-07]|uniref:hypothetical protein n=1 Tax=Rhodococcus sp. AQ5-07 TaxID=2054902 RepID=UPI000DBFD6F5|nr:hypothetical protein [Rhodococcus sp. AQ5-07]RAL31154.1 hypothetical protein CVN56_29740 [Rhodococcus sp. AQ5-07]